MSNANRPHSRTKDLKGVRQQWKRRGLPDTLEGQTVLDIGCWAGGYTKVAMEKGARRAIGVDICRSPQMHDIEFEQLDFMSDAALVLPQVDHVFLMGVLYHTHDPVGLLLRARRLCIHQLWIETAVAKDTNFPLIKCYDDHTNWFKPNKQALFWMLRKAGFEPDYAGEEYQEGRFAVSASPVEVPISRPRGIDWMDL